MNASLQCLRRVNELKDALINYKRVGGDPAEGLVGAWSKTTKQLETKGDAVTPGEFFQVNLRISLTCSVSLQLHASLR
jgi:hypothetical protein